MWNYEQDRERRVAPMILVLAIALLALIAIGSLHAQAHQGEEIPQRGAVERTTSDLVRNDEQPEYTISVLPVGA